MELLVTAVAAVLLVGLILWPKPRKGQAARSHDERQHVANRIEEQIELLGRRRHALAAEIDILTAKRDGLVQEVEERQRLTASLHQDLDAARQHRLAAIDAEVGEERQRRLLEVAAAAEEDRTRRLAEAEAELADHRSEALAAIDAQIAAERQRRMAEIADAVEQTRALRMIEVSAEIAIHRSDALAAIDDEIGEERQRRQADIAATLDLERADLRAGLAAEIAALRQSQLAERASDIEAEVAVERQRRVAELESDVAARRNDALIVIEGEVTIERQRLLAEAAAAAQGEGARLVAATVAQEIDGRRVAAQTELDREIERRRSDELERLQLDIASIRDLRQREAEADIEAAKESALAEVNRWVLEERTRLGQMLSRKLAAEAPARIERELAELQRRLMAAYSAGTAPDQAQLRTIFETTRAAIFAALG